MVKGKPIKNKTKYYYFVGIILITFILIFFIQATNFKLNIERRISPGEKFPEDIQGTRIPIYHAHADFKVFLDGEEFSFNKSPFDEANKYIHLHLQNPDGDKVIHVEGMENITLKVFFESLGMTFNSTCFILDAGESFCNTFDKRIRFFVNGNENFQFDLYELRDMNRILITYGNQSDEEIMHQMESVTDYACIYSGRCPERIAELPVSESELIF